MLMNLMGRIPNRYVLGCCFFDEEFCVLDGTDCSYGRCILLLEDLDAAFTRSVTRDASSTGTPTTTTTTVTATTTRVSGSSRRRGAAPVDDSSDGNSLSLSGLLNALDGVAASEGRCVFLLFPYQGSRVTHIYKLYFLYTGCYSQRRTTSSASTPRSLGQVGWTSG
jgi:hypothetical protein